MFVGCLAASKRFLIFKFALRRYENCEMRTVIISDGGGDSGGLDPLWFPGGHKLDGYTDK